MATEGIAKVQNVITDRFKEVVTVNWCLSNRLKVVVTVHDVLSVLQDVWGCNNRCRRCASGGKCRDQKLCINSWCQRLFAAVRSCNRTTFCNSGRFNNGRGRSQQKKTSVSRRCGNVDFVVKIWAVIVQLRDLSSLK